MGLPESEITKQIRDVLKAAGIWHYKHYSGGAYQPRRGISDIIGCYEGRFLAIEAKREGWTKPEIGTKAYKHYLEQRQFLEEVVDAGGIGFFASSPETVIKKLDLKCQLYPLFSK